MSRLVIDEFVINQALDALALAYVTAKPMTEGRDLISSSFIHLTQAKEKEKEVSILFWNKRENKTPCDREHIVAKGKFFYFGIYDKKNNVISTGVANVDFKSITKWASTECIFKGTE